MTATEYLRLLGIADKPTKAAIKRAFRQAAPRHHPDAKGTDKDFIKLKKAYDRLMSLSDDELARLNVAKPDLGGRYDPFNDPDYNSRVFFSPDNPATEGFERKLRARGCPHCRALGHVTKNVDPAKGFMGRETRLCRCQWV